MRWRFHYAVLTCVVVASAFAFAGCGSDAQQTDGGANMDADFSICLDTPAVPYMPGMNVTSTSGAYVVTVETAVTDGTPPIPSPRVGTNTWQVSVTDAASGMPATDVALTAERPTMPLHGHGAPIDPVTTPGEPGTFTISMIKFFMAGYWEFKFDLQPITGAVDHATFAICVPS